MSSIDELNQKLWNKCLEYRKNHKIQDRDLSVNNMYLAELSFLNTIPVFRFDTSKTIVARVNDYSTVRFDKNNYSVPTKYLRKEVTVKCYGNHIRVLYLNIEIASYARCYATGKTKYELDHYIGLLERKPRAVFNAKPVKENVTRALLDWGKQLPGGNKEMVKLLRLCVDYGEERILNIKDLIPSVQLLFLI